MANGNSRSGLWLALILLLFTALMVPAAWFLPPGWNFIVLMGLMILFMITLGVSISGRPAGILIDERNLMSLSRLQMILWTLIILSAYLAIALERVHTKLSIPKSRDHIGPKALVSDGYQHCLANRVVANSERQEEQGS